MGMTEEMMNDTLDDFLTESGDEEEQDQIVNQVLDEIGIEISGKVEEALKRSCNLTPFEQPPLSRVPCIKLKLCQIV